MKVKFPGDVTQAVLDGAPNRNAEWEHKQVEQPDTAEIAPHTSDGWELVSVVRAARPDNVIAYFKRRK